MSDAATKAAETGDELRAMVSDIVDELEAAASGDLYDVEGGLVVVRDMDEWKENEYAQKVEVFKKEHPESEGYDKDSYSSYEDFMESEIGTVDDVDEPGRVDLGECLEREALGDVKFEVDDGMDLCGGRLLVACGGPNIWVHDNEVRGYWGSSQYTEPLDSDAREALWNWFSEQWDMAKETMRWKT